MDDNLVFVTVTEGSYPKKLAFTYLDDVRKEFQGSYKREDYLDPVTQLQSKQLMRFLLAHHLGGAPLNTRQILIDLLQL